MKEKYYTPKSLDSQKVRVSDYFLLNKSINFPMNMGNANNF